MPRKMPAAKPTTAPTIVQVWSNLVELGPLFNPMTLGGTVIMKTREVGIKSTGRLGSLTITPS